MTEPCANEKEIDLSLQVFIFSNSQRHCSLKCGLLLSLWVFLTIFYFKILGQKQCYVSCWINSAVCCICNAAKTLFFIFSNRNCPTDFISTFVNSEFLKGPILTSAQIHVKNGHTTLFYVTSILCFLELPLLLGMFLMTFMPTWTLQIYTYNTLWMHFKWIYASSTKQQHKKVHETHMIQWTSKAKILLTDFVTAACSIRCYHAGKWSNMALKFVHIPREDVKYSQPWRVTP